MGTRYPETEVASHRHSGLVPKDIENNGAGGGIWTPDHPLTNRKFAMFGELAVVHSRISGSAPVRVSWSIEYCSAFVFRRTTVNYIELPVRQKTVTTR